MRLAPLLAAALLFSSSAALAQSTSGPGFDADVDGLVVAGGLTADQVAARAAAVSPTVRRRHAEVAERDADVRSAKLAWIPRVTVSASYTRLSEVDSPELAPGFSFPSYLDSFANHAELAVPLSDYLLRVPHGVAAAELGSDAARLSERAAALAAASDARVIYYEWIRAQLQVVVAEQSIAQVQATLDRMNVLLAAQSASRADVLRLQAKAAEARQTAQALRNLATLRERQLRQAIDASADEPLAVGEDVRADVAVAPGALDALLAQADRRRLEVRTLDTALGASARGRRATRAGRLPRLDAFASLAYDNPNQRIVPSTDEFAMTWSAGLRLSWSLPDVLAVTPALDRSSAQDQQLRADRASLAQAIELQVVAARQDVTLAAQALATSAEGLAAAEEGYRVRQELLVADRATAVEVIDAEADLTRARFAAIDARIDLRIALTRLDHATGADAPAVAD